VFSTTASTWLKALTIIFEPVIPQTMETAWKGLGQETDVHAAQYEDALVPLKAGTKLAKPEILFTKLEDDRIGEMEEIANQTCKSRKLQRKMQQREEKRSLRSPKEWDLRKRQNQPKKPERP